MTQRSRVRFLILAIVAAAAIPYLDVVPCTFVYDDHGIIEEAPLIHSLGGAWKLLTSDTWLAANQQPSGLYRPLTSVSFAINWALAGPSPAAFRIVNVLLHVLVSVLLFVTLRRFGAGEWAAFAASVLFAVHPLHTEAVTWPVGRAELFAAAFFIAGWLVHLRRDDADTRTGVAVGALYLLAMTGKESAATLPIVLVLGDSIRRASRLIKSPPRRSARWWTARYGPVAAAFALFLVVRWRAVGMWTPPGILEVMNPVAALPLIDRLAGASVVIGRYLLLMIWPARLSVDYSYRALDLPGSFAAARSLIPAAIVVALLVAAFALRRRHPIASLGLFFPAATGVLTANVLFPIGTIMAERLAYLPSAGICIVLGWLFARAWEAVARRNVTARAVVAVMLVALASAGIARSWSRNAVWADDVKLWEDTVLVVPDSFWAHFKLASLKLQRGEDEPALAAFRECLRIRPKTPELHNEIGDILRRRGDLKGAGEEFRAEIALNPSSSRAVFNLGLVHLARGRKYLAKESFIIASNKDPRNMDALYNAGVLTMEEGSLAEARTFFERALAVDPSATNARINLAVACLGLGDQTCAREAARVAAASGVALPPDLAALIR